MNPHDITKDFEKELCRYTGAPFAVALDSCANALFLSLLYEGVKGVEVEMPANTYMAAPCEVIHAGGKVKFIESERYLTGPYRMSPTCVIDSALRFTADMFEPGMFHCLSFTGPYKHLKLGKGGAILTDDEKAYKWFKKARFSGRAEMSYHEDNFDIDPVIGWNFYMLPEIAAKGIHLMTQFYNLDGSKKHNEDLSLPYPDLSKFECYR